MKKILSLTLALLMLLSLAACTGGTEETTAADTDESDSSPVVSLVCEKTTVSPGEEITVNIHISDAPLTACFDILVFADEAVQAVDVETCPSELILAANNEAKNGEEYVILRGMVAAAYDVLDDDVCTVTYKVKDDAESGSKINFTLQVPLYQLALDESGNDVYSVDCTLQGLVLEVK